MKEKEMLLGVESHNISNWSVSSKFTDLKNQEIIFTNVELKFLI